MKIKAIKNRNFGLRVKQTEYDDIKRIAERDNIPMAQVIMKAVRWYLYGSGEER